MPHPLTPERAYVRAELVRARVVAVLRDTDGHRAERRARALLELGLTALEITFPTPGCPAILDRLARRFPGACLGAGTILERRQLEQVASAGARFVVSPHTDPEIIEHAQALSLVSIPGALTPTEVVRAHQAGADFVKLFPVSALGGAAYLRWLRGPLPEIPLWVSGDVSLEDLPAYFAAGATLAGLTSALTGDLPADGEREALAARVQAALDRCRA